MDEVARELGGAMANSTTLTRVQRRQRWERILGVIAIMLLIVAWVIGASRSSSSLLPAVMRALPDVHHVEEINNELFQAWGDPGEENLLGYIALGEANGYGGPLILAVAVTPDGEVIGAAVADHKETSSWMARVLGNGFLNVFTGKSYSDPFVLGNDIDAMTGATYTTRAMSEAVLEASHSVARYVGLPAPAEASPRLVIGVPEVALVLLFVVGYIGRRQNYKYTKQVRWASLITGLVVLGFLYNNPLTLSNINKFLLGFWPQWQTSLYVYLLIGGILLVFSADNKNPYCEWFCPFGAAQECMGVLGGAKVRSSGPYRMFLKWLQRGLAWGAIFIALLYRNPGVTSYEIFGTLFELIGSNLQFLLLGLVLLASLYIRRPWCTYLCPLHPVDEFIRMVRKWVLEQWKTRIARKRNA
jgi:NosR/NirI family nitrous oxide reductase transcriptional regulator